MLFGYLITRASRSSGASGSSWDSSNGSLPASRLLNKGSMSRGILGPEPRCCIARKGETMSYARQMLDTYPRTLTLDPGLLAAAIDAASDCAEACTADTDADQLRR
jgi:hypothetical protein